MSQNKNLTNEKLTNLFENPFDLVSYAINIAHESIEAGRDFSDASDKNAATQILKKILKDKQDESKSEEILKSEMGAKKTDKDLPDPMLCAV